MRTSFRHAREQVRETRQAYSWAEKVFQSMSADERQSVKDEYQTLLDIHPTWSEKRCFLKAVRSTIEDSNPKG